MATKLVKIISNQSGPFTVNNNLVDITLPSYLGACDLSDTCVEIDLKLVKASDGSDVPLFDYGFKNDPRLDSTCLIKNVKFSSDKGGVLEEIAQPNVLHANLSPYETDFEARRDDWYYGQSINPFGTFINKVDSGTTQSTARTALKLPLSSLLGIGKMKQFSNSLFGDCKIHLEFEDNTHIVKSLFQAYTDTKVYTGAAAGKSITLANQLVPNGNNVWNGMPVAVSLSNAPVNGLSDANPAVLSIKGPTAAPAQKFLMPAVGDTITISGVTGTDENEVNVTTTVTSLVPSSTQANLDLNLNGKSFDATNAIVTITRNNQVLSSSYNQGLKTVTYTFSGDLINEAVAGGTSPTIVANQSFRQEHLLVQNTLTSLPMKYETFTSLCLSTCFLQPKSIRWRAR